TSGGGGAVRAYSTNQTGAFMADATTVDYNLDFRVDVVYAGSVICNGTTTSSGCGGTGPVWKGAMWRLTTNGGDTNPDNWGFNTGSDKSNTDIQHFLGVKDCIVSSGCTNQTVERNNLFNSSNVVTCSSCASGSNVSTTGSTSSFTIGFSAGGGNLVNSIQNMDGWFTTFNDPTAPLQTPPRAAITPGARNLASATLLGGTA